MELIFDGILKAFQLLLTLNPEVLGITLLSLQVSGAATLISVLIGLSTGTVVALNNFPGKRFLVSVVNTGMGLPPVVVGLFVMIKKNKVKCWLVNTGLSGGPFGLGERLKIAYTRAMIHQALNGKLDDVPTETDPIFNLRIPTACEGVPKEILTPRNTWRKPKDYDTKARDLAERFKENFKQFAAKVSTKVKKAGPAGS